MEIEKTVLGMLAACAVAVLAGCGASSDTDRASTRSGPVEVIGQPVEFRNETQRIEAVGTARARQAATLYPESNGEVTQIRFEAGEVVATGSILATLDDAEERLAIALAKVTLQEARQLLDRYERIDVPGAVSESQIDAARTAVEAAEIDLDLAREALNQRLIRAPFSGYVGIPQVDAGERITPQTAITQLDDRQSLFVDFEASEQVFGRISVGDTLRILPFADSGRSVEAVVKSIGSRIDPQRRLFTIRTEVDNGNDALRPGMSFRVGFDIEGEAFPAVPEAAIIWGGDGAYLWTVEEGTAKRMAVTIIARAEGEVLVRAPLAPGDIIIAEGVQKVRDGAQVTDISGASDQQGEFEERRSDGRGKGTGASRQ